MLFLVHLLKVLSFHILCGKKHLPLMHLLSGATYVHVYSPSPQTASLKIENPRQKNPVCSDVTSLTLTLLYITFLC